MTRGFRAGRAKYGRQLSVRKSRCLATTKIWIVKMSSGPLTWGCFGLCLSKVAPPATIQFPPACGSMNPNSKC